VIIIIIMIIIIIIIIITITIILIIMYGIYIALNLVKQQIKAFFFISRIME